MYLQVESQRCMLDAVGQAQLQVQGQHLMVGTALGGVEPFELPANVSEYESHMEGGVACLEMRTYVRSDGERRVGLVYRIDGFEGHAHFPAGMQLASVHHIDKDVACAERAAGQIAVLVRIFHVAVVQIMESHREVIRILRLPLLGLGEGFRLAEVMSVEHGAEHRSGQVIGEIELQGPVGGSVEQGGVAHTHGDVTVAEADVGPSEGVQTRRDRQTHEREDRPAGVGHLCRRRRYPCARAQKNKQE